MRHAQFVSDLAAFNVSWARVTLNCPALGARHAHIFLDLPAPLCHTGRNICMSLHPDPAGLLTPNAAKLGNHSAYHSFFGVRTKTHVSPTWLILDVTHARLALSVEVFFARRSEKRVDRIQQTDDCDTVRFEQLEQGRFALEYAARIRDLFSTQQTKSLVLFLGLRTITYMCATITV